MEEFYYDIITFLGTMSPVLKVFIVGLLFMMVGFTVVSIVKTHVNPKKFVLKLGQFFLLAVLVALTIFVCINVF